MKVAAIIQARMGSTRLPRKVLKEVLGKSLLEYQIERVKRAKMIDEIIIATTIKEEDNPIVKLCEKLSIPYYRGSEDDVLSRYFEAAKEYKVDVIVRLTSDCPVIDSEVIDKAIRVFLTGEHDYVSNSIERTYPRGMDTEVFSYQGLEEIHQKATKPHEREHVTPYFYQHSEKFNLKNVFHSEDLSKYRLTVDTKEDLELIQCIIQDLYPNKHNFTLKDIKKSLEANPDLLFINSHVEQKKLNE
jgi:spore coat polysaccharide biosynthesis protein SpsF